MAGITGTCRSTFARIQEIRNLSESAYVLRFDRNGMEFEPGQYVSVGVKGEGEVSDYTIYSPAHTDYLEILVKEVAGGCVSRRLRRLRTGDELEVDGPFGFFTIDEENLRTGRFLFIATGTGLSPFHCYAQSFSALSYTILHGVRSSAEQYEYDAYPTNRISTCVSREPVPPAMKPGRVTDYLREIPIDPDMLCYVSGGSDMIYDVFEILEYRGMDLNRLFAEIYY